MTDNMDNHNSANLHTKKPVEKGHNSNSNINTHIDANTTKDALNTHPSSTDQLYKAPSTSIIPSHHAPVQTNDKRWYHFSGRIGRLRYISYQLFIVILFYLSTSVCCL